jgi:hypothetical protein
MAHESAPTTDLYDGMPWWWMVLLRHRVSSLISWLLLVLFAMRVCIPHLPLQQAPVSVYYYCNDNTIIELHGAAGVRIWYPNTNYVVTCDDTHKLPGCGPSYWYTRDAVTLFLASCRTPSPLCPCYCVAYHLCVRLNDNE